YKKSEGAPQLRASVHHDLEAGRRLRSLPRLDKEGNRAGAMRRKTAEMGPRREVAYGSETWQQLKDLRDRAAIILKSLKALDMDAAVFGSVARGDVKPTSDVDVFIPRVENSIRVGRALEEPGIRERSI